MKLGKRPRPAMPRTNTVKEFSSDQMAVDPPPPAVANHHTAFSAHFLTACSLCKRRLIPGRDIYMYRGDTGFCSQECREQQIKRDERKEKCSVFTSKRKGAGAAAATSAAAATGPNGVANPSAAV